MLFLSYKLIFVALWIFLIDLRVLLLRRRMIFEVFLLWVIAGWIIGIKHIDEFISGAEGRDGVEGSLILIDLSENESFIIEVL